MSNYFRNGQFARALFAAILALAATGVAWGQQSFADFEQLRQRYESQQGTMEYQSPLDASRQTGSQGSLAKRNTERQSLFSSSYSGSLRSSPESSLEKDYSSRAGSPLRQFGYDAFSQNDEGVINGAVSEDYRLGIGDEIVLTLHGQTSKTVTTRIDREGRVVVPDLLPIAAAGRSFGDVRNELEARVRDSMIGTEVFISVGALRMVSVMVAGEVERPGVQQVTGLSTVLDALYAAGGVRKTGSLRRILLQRNGANQVFDAYRILLGGASQAAPALQAGDRIVVPPIGKTVAVTGAVKRPGVYELDSQGREVAERLIGWAGGPIRSKGNRYLRSALDVSGRESVSELARLNGVVGEDSDIFIVQFGDGAQEGAVFLQGHVRIPGMRALEAAPTVRALVRDVFSLKSEPYLLFAALMTTDDATHSRRMEPVSLQRVLSGEVDYPLKDQDTLIVLGNREVHYLLSSDVQGLLARKELVVRNAEIRAESGDVNEAQLRSQAAVSSKDLCSGLRELSLILASERAGRYANAVRSVRGGVDNAVEYSGECPEIYDTYPRLLPFVLEHVVVLSGEVRQPGAYPIERETKLSSLISFAGGLSREADVRNVEISRDLPDAAHRRVDVSRVQIDLNVTPADTFRVNPGDVARFNSVDSDRESGAVLLVGEFVHPGFYDLTRGERLSDVIGRAGGLTNQAYPYGAVFSRERIKRQEEKNYRRAATDLQDSMLAVMAKGESSASDASAVAAVNSLVKQLKETEAVGRIVVEADPTVLQVRPELDTILEAGDTIYMPKRANVVSVAGEVLNPGAMSFIPGSKADDYLKLAGGVRRYGDEDRIFVIKPNGTAQPLRVSSWNYEPVQIPPGSTIVVPRDPAPFDLMTFTRDIAGLFADLAISAASLATIDGN